LKDIRDCCGRIACKFDVNSGFVEVVYKRIKTSTQIAIGGAFRIEREGVITLITRNSDATFFVESHLSPD